MADIASNFISGFNAAQGAKQRRFQRKIQSEQMEMERGRFSMEQEKFQMQKDALEQQQQKQKEMSEAARRGGYNGVVEYLENTDPAYALEVKKAKSDLDLTILQGENVKAKTADQKQKTLESAYMQLGNFARIINQLPDEEKADFYESISFNLQQIVPDAPSVYNERAKNMLLLGVGQAIPANQVWQAEKDQEKAATELGKTIQDMDRLRAQGHAEDSTEMKAMYQQLGDFEKAKRDAHMKNMEAKSMNKQKGEDLLRKEYLQLTKTYQGAQDAYNTLQSIREDDYSGTAATDIAIVFGTMQVIEPTGIVREGEQYMMKSAGSYSQRLLGYWKNVQTGEGLTPTMRKELHEMADMNIEGKKLSYEQYKKEYTYLSTKRGYDVKSIVLDLETPSTKKSKSENNVDREAIERQAQEAIQKGADPEKVEAMKQQLLGGQK